MIRNKGFSLLACWAFFIAACGGVTSLGSGSGSDGIRADDDGVNQDEGSPCAGKPCGAPCSDCVPGEPCPEIAQFCAEDGTCGGFPTCETQRCESDGDCEYPEGPCQLCPDGSNACPSASCVEGQCVVQAPECSGYSPCAGKGCGDPCTQCAPNDPDCFETAVLKTCDSAGSCTPGQAQCANQCSLDSDCPLMEICKPCPSGDCARVACIGGACGWECPASAKPECATARDCEPHIMICEECGDGSCAEMDCVAGQCRFVCK